MPPAASVAHRHVARRPEQYPRSAPGGHYPAVVVGRYDRACWPLLLLVCPPVQESRFVRRPRWVTGGASVVAARVRERLRVLDRDVLRPLRRSTSVRR